MGGWGDAALQHMIKQQQEDLHTESLDAVIRKTRLKVFAESLAAAVKNKDLTDCEAFAQIIEYDASLVSQDAFAAFTMVHDLTRVLIGDGLRDGSGRGKGPFVVKGFKATGFKKEYWDKYNQVQHAMAGIYIGYHHNFFIKQYVLLQEDQPQDDRLYEATFALGESLNSENYRGFASQVRAKLCE